MDELTERKRRKRVTPIKPLDLSTLNACEAEPQRLIQTLAFCNGDVDKFVRQFYACDHDSKMAVLYKTFLILNKPENLSIKTQWDASIQAYKETKIAFAEREAFNWIGDYKPPVSQDPLKQVPLTVANAYMKTWLSEYFTVEKQRGKDKAESGQLGMQDNSIDEMLEQMKGGA